MEPAFDSLMLPSDAAVNAFIQKSNLNLALPPIELAAEILREFSQFPYENISKIIKLNQDFDGSPFRSPDEIMEDYYRYSLGGTCFSLTNFLQEIMNHFDFSTHIVMADMNSGPNTHCALVLTFEKQDYLMDPGYLLQAPLLLKPVVNLIQPQNGVYLQWNPAAGTYSLFTLKNGNPTYRYTFINRATSRQEFLNHWARSFHWMTMHGICLSQKDSDGLIYMHNNYLKMERTDKRHKGKIDLPLEVIARQYFNIPDEVTRRAREALEQNLHYDKELGFEVPQWVK